jgi:hypothetical protein
MIVNCNDLIDAGDLEQVRIETRRKRLSVEFLEISRIPRERREAVFWPRPPILSAVEEIRFQEDNTRCSIVLGGTGFEEISHRKLIP